ncbi:MAG: polyphosphate kinase 2, partial [Pseudomonadota bacterium]
MMTARKQRTRRVAQGDRPPTLTAAGLARYIPERSTRSARAKQQQAVSSILSAKDDLGAEKRIKELRALIQGASPDDVAAIRDVFLSIPEIADRNARGAVINPDEELAKDWRQGSYPYKNLMRRSS